MTKEKMLVAEQRKLKRFLGKKGGRSEVPQPAWLVHTSRCNRTFVTLSLKSFSNTHNRCNEHELYTKHYFMAPFECNAMLHDISASQKLSEQTAV